MMERRMMIASSAVLLAAVAVAIAMAAVAAGSASADSGAPVYGSDDQPYAGMDAGYGDLEDGATYYIAKGGYVSISFAGIDAKGMETDLAGSGLMTDYVGEKIYGEIEKSVSLTLGAKTIKMEISEGTPTYGSETYAYILDSVNAYIALACNEYVDFEQKNIIKQDASSESINSESLSEYGLTASVKHLDGNKKLRIVIAGTPTKGTGETPFVIEFVQKWNTYLSKATIIYRVLVYIEDEFTIHYEANGGSCIKSIETVKYGSSTILPSATMDDHHLTGWYLQSGGGNFCGNPGDSFDPLYWGRNVRDGVTLYAQWELDKNPVTEMKIDGATSVQVGKTAILTAITGPDDADNRHVTFYAQTGTGYAKIISQTKNDSGGTCTIEGLAAGTFVVRATADDGSGKYVDWTITVTEAPVESYTFTLQYSANKGTGAPVKFSTTTTSTQYTTTVSTVKPTRSGYTFLGWSTDPSDTTKEYVGGDSITLRSNKTTTLYAVWEEIKVTWTLTFDANGGSGAPSMLSEKVAGTSYVWTLPSTKPVLEGYTFSGWARSASSTVGGYQPNGEFVSYVQDAVLYAVWEESASGYEFHVIFDDAKGSGGPGSIDMTDSSKTVNIRIPETKPTRAGYEFMGWGVNAGTSAVAYYPGETYTFSQGTTTLFAVWKQFTYVLTLYDTDTSGNRKTVEGVGVGEVSVTIPSDYIPTRSGYTFSGWSVAKGGSASYQPGQIIKLTENLSLFGVWVKSDEVEPAVHFNVTCDESQSTTVTLKKADDGTYRFPKYDLIREGYTFLGWADVDNAPAAVYHEGDVIDMSTPKVLQVYAVWKIEETTWTVEFDANNGSGAPDGLSLPATSATTQLYFTIPAANLVRSGYTFDGWADDEDASRVAVAPSGGTYIATKQHTTLKAVWKLGDPEEFTVTFDANGGSGGPGTMTSDGASFELPDVTPVFANHVFVGWEWTHDGTTETVVPGITSYVTLVDKATVFTAVWKEIAPDTVFDVFFDLAGGSGEGIAPQSTVSSAVPAKFTIPSGYSPTKSGCEFLGWSTNKNGEDRIQPGETVELTAAETMLYAVWKVTSFSAPALSWELSVNGSVLTFDGSASENVTSWVWDFGDGSRSSEMSGTHTYQKAGTYTVKLTVYSASGMSETRSKNVVATEGHGGSSGGSGIAAYVAVAIIAMLIAVVALRFVGVF